MLLRTPGELQQIINGNPFLKGQGVDTAKLHITFLSEAPTEPCLSQLKGIQSEPDKFLVIEREIYFYCNNGYGRTRLSNDFFEKKLGVTATTRAWKTVNALLDIAKTYAK